MKLKKLGLLPKLYTNETAHVVKNIAMQRLQGRNQSENSAEANSHQGQRTLAR